MCKAMNKTVKVIAAELPFSNGLVEKNKVRIGNMSHKTDEDQQLSLDLVQFSSVKIQFYLPHFLMNSSF